MRLRQVNTGGYGARRPGAGHRRQVRVLGPQAERAVRPDPVDYPHELLPIAPALTLTRAKDNVARTAGAVLFGRFPRGRLALTGLGPIGPGRPAGLGLYLAELLVHGPEQED